MLMYVATWLQLKTDRRGVTAIEYGLIASLVALAIVTAVGLLGTGLTGRFTAITSAL